MKCYLTINAACEIEGQKENLLEQRHKGPEQLSIVFIVNLIKSIGEILVYHENKKKRRTFEWLIEPIHV